MSIALSIAGRTGVPIRYGGACCELVIIQSDNSANVADGVLVTKGNCVAEIVENVFVVTGECNAEINKNVIYVK